jgi:hypothetical protein
VFSVNFDIKNQVKHSCQNIVLRTLIIWIGRRGQVRYKQTICYRASEGIFSAAEGLGMLDTEDGTADVRDTGKRGT